MIGNIEFHRMVKRSKWGFFLAMGVLVLLLLGVGSVYAFPDQRVDTPNPRIEPLIESVTDVPTLTSLANSYRGPGIYEIDIASNGEVSMVNRWCTKTETILHQNLGHIHFAFEVNGLDVVSSLHNFEEVDFDESGQRMVCHGYRGLLSNWPQGEHNIKYALSFDEEINDGWGDYPAGELNWEYDVTVSAASEVTGVPVVSVTTNTNCRVGPGKAYDIIGALRVGETAEIVGKYPDSNYWIIFEPNVGRECWLWGYYAVVSGDTDQLTVYVPPPLPTPTPTPSPESRYLICFCNDTTDYISTIQLINDDTDEWMGEYGSDGLPPGFCICNCNSTSEPYPAGDYAITYKICSDGAACQNFGASRSHGFEDLTGTEMFRITP